MLCPWEIAPEAVRDYARICGVESLREGPKWDRYERELIRVVRVALELPTKRRSSSGELVYRVQVGTTLWLRVSDSETRPRLIRVAAVRPVLHRVPGPSPSR